MEVILAKTAGYCIGVKMAVEKVYDKLPTEKLSTYGPIIHNKHVTNDLAKKGVNIIHNINEIELDRTVVIRTHGVPPIVYEEMDKNNINYVDYTCPFVKKIHRIVEKETEKGNAIIIVGDSSHPEIKGINGFANNKSIIIHTIEEALKAQLIEGTPYSIVVQTTFENPIFDEIVQILQAKLNNTAIIHNTICNATLERQKEANELSKKVDKMIVIGDKVSANSNKLYKICKENCENTYFVESIDEIELNIFKTNDKIGITAGASTPSAVIKEAVTKMNELDKNENLDTSDEQSFEEMLESSFVILHTGDVVKGTVLQITDNEVSVNLNYKSDGVITKDELSDDPNVNPKDLFNVGDEIEVYVMKVNDGDGNITLSRKRIEEQKNIAQIEAAYNDKTVLKGKVIDIVKGGLMARIKGVRVFVPSSQVSSRFVDDLQKFKGQELSFHIIEFNRERRRMVAGRKELAIKEEQERKQTAIENLQAGMEVSGRVSRIVGFGVFVDLGDIDGLIHITELGWNRNKKPTGMFEIGDIVKAKVLKLDTEKLKVSLSIKDLLGNPWDDIEDKYPQGSIVEGSIVRMVKFGAFVELEAGVDGLIHISQISRRHISKAEDILEIDQVVKVKVMEIDRENKKISLSKKEADLELGLEDPFDEDEEVLYEENENGEEIRENVSDVEPVDSSKEE